MTAQTRAAEAPVIRFVYAYHSKIKIIRLNSGIYTQKLNKNT